MSLGHHFPHVKDEGSCAPQPRKPSIVRWKSGPLEPALSLPKGPHREFEIRSGFSPAAKRRKNAAHSASCGWRGENQPAPEGAADNSPEPALSLPKGRKSWVRPKKWNRAPLEPALSKRSASKGTARDLNQLCRRNPRQPGRARRSVVPTTSGK